MASGEANAVENPQRRRSGRAPGSSWLEEDGSVPVLLSLSMIFRFGSYSVP
uniref:Uncharacterized protein n=1 Tax=Fagus sylvatica TaxID=28930 RepID=A0A2N9HBV3_FAGSY